MDKQKTTRVDRRDEFNPRFRGLLGTLSSRMSVDIDPIRYPFLMDHRIASDPVLPVVLVQEWFARAALANAHDTAALEIENLQVLRGVVLEAYPERNYGFEIALNATCRGSRRFDVRLADGKGGSRYAARIAALEDDAAAGTPPEPPPGTSLATAVVYGDGRLFHGPAFRTIRRIGAMSEAGGVAEISTTAEREWPGDGWVTDPAAIDGCLQFARLWTLERTGEPSLPARIATCRIFRRAAAGESYVCHLRSRMVDRYRSEHEIDLTLDGGVAIAIRGLEMYRTARGR